MDDVRDYGIAVRDAIRLNDCYKQLRKLVSSNPLIESDRSYCRWSDDDCEDLKDYTFSIVAMCIFNDIIRERKIDFWIKIESEEDKIDICSFDDYSDSIFYSGIYEHEDDSRNWLSGRPIWVKSADWRRVLSMVAANRLGDACSPDLNAKGTADPRQPLPSLSEIALKAWLASLSDEEKALATDSLWKLCKAAHPDKSITRSRIRALMPNRKPGPRQFSGKPLAQ